MSAPCHPSLGGRSPVDITANCILRQTRRVQRGKQTASGKGGNWANLNAAHSVRDSANLNCLRLGRNSTRRLARARRRGRPPDSDFRLPQKGYHLSLSDMILEDQVGPKSLTGRPPDIGTQLGVRGTVRRRARHWQLSLSRADELTESRSRAGRRGRRRRAGMRTQAATDIARAAFASMMLEI
jgi:hypothetical protein